MSALVDLLRALQSAPRLETHAGHVLIFDAARTREVADAIERLDAQMSADLCNLDGFAHPSRAIAELRWTDATLSAQLIPLSQLGQARNRVLADLRHAA
ncbi:hypothetical protein EA661_12875 [Pseudoxanthomonas winnipegensis]|uniref:Uncharacterized protein n=1 Tax=Pseudoxanthomonas winnipegensis TaxID=2480810 RepID=A0A4Q8LF85_9GAMM|nr:hypothetical protein [Pseudoxanthomonas winnipegensis]TAA27644.1 hypothetical protein EA661_12875 [Pseudoxanthomonas winnipegensis]